MMKIQKTIVMIIGHERPDYLIDTAESIRYYNKENNYEIVFAIDYNKDVANTLVNKYGQNHVFVSEKPNGWGRGILRTIVHALDYFKPRISFSHVITFDSDALCIGPFIDVMLKKIDTSEVLFVGSIWHTPSKDQPYHQILRKSGFMSDFPYTYRSEMAAGPCMLWTSHAFKVMQSVGLLPGVQFDKVYNSIQFAHDQLSTWFHSCGLGIIKDVTPIMEIKWRQSLPTTTIFPWGEVPAIRQSTSIIHPTKSNRYTEDNCRAYFKSKRIVETKLQTEEEWKAHFRTSNTNSFL